MRAGLASQCAVYKLAPMGGPSNQNPLLYRVATLADLTAPRNRSRLCLCTRASWRHTPNRQATTCPKIWCALIRRRSCARHRACSKLKLPFDHHTARARGQRYDGATAHGRTFALSPATVPWPRLGCRALEATPLAALRPPHLSTLSSTGIPCAHSARQPASPRPRSPVLAVLRAWPAPCSLLSASACAASSRPLPCHLEVLPWSFSASARELDGSSSSES